MKEVNEAIEEYFNKKWNDFIKQYGADNILKHILSDGRLVLLVDDNNNFCLTDNLRDNNEKD